ncbi:MAG: CDP-alcohol phosphatidyltransferase family protein [Chlorobiota bacterium]
MEIKFNISNNISILRIALSFPLAYFLIQGNTSVAIIIGILAFISDYLDGYFARSRDEITDLGKVLDPLADKLFFGTAAVIMIVQGLIPTYLAVIIVARDILIFLGGIYVKNKTGVVMASNLVGKGAVNIAAIVLIGILLNINGFYTYGSVIAASVFVLSFVIYMFNAYKLLKSK